MNLVNTSFGDFFFQALIFDILLIFCLYCWKKGKSAVYWLLKMLLSGTVFGLFCIGLFFFSKKSQS